MRLPLIAPLRRFFRKRVGYPLAGALKWLRGRTLDGSWLVSKYTLAQEIEDFGFLASPDGGEHSVKVLELAGPTIALDWLYGKAKPFLGGDYIFMSEERVYGITCLDFDQHWGRVENQGGCRI